MLRDAAYALMGRRRRSIEADRNHVDPKVGKATNDLIRQLGCHTGRNAHRDPELARVGDKIKCVRPHQYVTACEDEDRIGPPKSRQALDKAQPLTR
jgi:hypothetical protein